MRLLLDTHFLVWLATDRSTLRRSEFSLIEDARNTLFASIVSIWELRIKWNARDSNGARKGVLSPRDGLALLPRANIELVGLIAADIIAALDPPPPHRDPFDEMLLVHAARVDANLLTRDRKLLDHPLAYQP